MKHDPAYGKQEEWNRVQKAVALRYQPGQDAAPVVKAKGSGWTARKIVETAAEHGVPIQQDASLVEVLSKLDLDQQIPPELYQLTAEILAFVYRSDREAAIWK
jgi:flagellar biosynthesis protein